MRRRRRRRHRHFLLFGIILGEFGAFYCFFGRRRGRRRGRCCGRRCGRRLRHDACTLHALRNLVRVLVDRGAVVTAILVVEWAIVVAEHLLSLAWDRAAEVLHPAGAVEAVPPQRLHHACQQLLRLSLARLEPVVSFHAIPGVACAPINAEDVARVASQCRDLCSGHRVGPFEIMGSCIVAVGATVDAALVKDDICLSQETHESCMAGWVACERLRAICIRSKGAPIWHRCLGGHGEQPPASILHHVPLVVRGADLVENTAVTPVSIYLGPPN
mmetsp:Transcript_163825/g.314694  ORF Transcript_163825/g.314694 Transcript_163825/m.314694 type:complete len:273 (+) Transcript_163825:680-1498(+)